VLFTVGARDLSLLQSPVSWIMGSLSLGVKQLGYEADQSTTSSAEVKNEWS
jgi:hypothetical protein